MSRFAAAIDLAVWMVRLLLLGVLILVGILGGALLVMRHLMGGCC